MQFDILAEAKAILEQESRAINNIPLTTAYPKAVDIIVSQIHDLNGKIVVSGMGKAGHVALDIATKFTSTGTHAINLHPADALHGDLGILCQNDVLLLLSNSGETREMLDLVKAARNLCPDVKIIVICGDDKSSLAAIADVLLFTGGAPEVCPLGFTPTTSITVMSVIGDILVVNVMKAINFTKEQYALRHHGGTLGIKSRQ